MTDRKSLEAALIALESQRKMLGEAVVDTAIAAIRTKLAQLRVPAPPSRNYVSALLLVSPLPNPGDSELLISHIERCVQRQQGQTLLVDEYEYIAVFRTQNEDDNVIENAVRAAQAIQTTPQAHRATYSLIPPMQMGIQSVIVREGIVEPHDYLAHLQTPLEAIRLAISTAQTTFANHDRTIVLISEGAFSFVEGIISFGETLAVEPHVWFVVSDYRDANAQYALPYSRHVASRLIDRRTELQVLQNHYRQTVTDRKAHVVSIVGVLGVGKTRLLMEYEIWLDMLTERLWYFKGCASPQLSQTPYGVFRDIFQNRFHIADNDLPDTARDKLVQGVQKLLPDFAEEDILIIGHLFGLDIGSVPLPARIHVSDAIQREVAYPLVVQFFRQIALLNSNALSLILEDLQWSDLESINLLEHLLIHSQDVAFICVCTMRPTMFEETPDWTTRMETANPAHVLIELRSMSEAVGRQLLNSVVQNRINIPDNCVQSLIRKSAGNPFQLETLIHLLIEENIINTSTQPWSFDEQLFSSIEIPATLVSLVQARLFSLPPDERITLQRAATIGNRFSATAVEFLNKSLPITPNEPADTILQRLESKQLVTRIGEPVPTYGVEYRFIHGVWQTVAYESLPRQSRQSLHSALAQWYIGQGLDRGSDNSIQIAYHFELAGDPRRSLKWYSIAAQKARESHRPTLAARYYQHALDLFPTESDDYVALVNLYEGLGSTLAHLTLYFEAATLYSAMCATAEAAGDWLGLAKAWNMLVEIEINRSDTDSAMNCAVQAMNTANRAGEAGRRELVAAWYHIAYVSLTRQNAKEAEGWLQKALPASEEIHDNNLTARIEKSFGHVFVHQNDYASAIRHFNQSLGRFRTLDDIMGAADVLIQLAEVFRRQGDYERARDNLHEALQIAEQTRSRRDIIVCMSDLGGIATAVGQHQLAKTQLQHVLTTTMPDGWWGIVGTYRYLTQAHLGLGDPDSALQTAQSTLEWAEIRQNPTDLGVAWRVLGMTAAAQSTAIVIENHVFNAAECFQKSCDYLVNRDTGELAETCRVWAQHEFIKGNELTGHELWQRAGQYFAEIGASSILDMMNKQRNFT